MGYYIYLFFIGFYTFRKSLSKLIISDHCLIIINIFYFFNEVDWKIINLSHNVGFYTFSKSLSKRNIIYDHCLINQKIKFCLNRIWIINGFILNTSITNGRPKSTNMNIPYSENNKPLVCPCRICSCQCYKIIIYIIILKLNLLIIKIYEINRVNHIWSEYD